MGAQYVIDAIRNYPRVSSIEKIDKFRLKIVIDGKSRLIYTPSNDDYEVTVDVVDKAHELGADLIVCDIWIKLTGAGMEHAKSKNIGLYKSGIFFARLRSDDQV